MDTLILARLQFALTIMFHYIFPILSIGLGLILVIIEGTYLKTKQPIYLQMAKFWTRIFALTFAIGVATGIVMEFEFGTNWATYSRYVGDVFGSALAAEGVFAFFLESGFLALLIFGWNKIGPKLHFFSTVMVCLGAHFSAIWIVVANAWMQTPAGFHIVGEGLLARAEIVDFWAMVFNPSSMTRLGHVILGCWLAGAGLVISVAAYYLLKQKYVEFSLKSLKIGLIVAVVTSVLTLLSGDKSGKIVAKYQPSKLAAFEGHYESGVEAPLVLFGIPNTQESRVDYALKIPKLLSYLSFGEVNAHVEGLDKVEKKDWPNIPLVFYAFRTMLLVWGLFFLFSLMAVWMWFKGTLLQNRWLLKLLVFSVLLPQIGNQAGWLVAESGRYPWIVYGLLRISDGLSKAVTANQIFGSIIMFGVIYFFLFALFLYLLNEKIQHGPEDIEDGSTPYHSLPKLVGEADHDNRV